LSEWSHMHPSGACPWGGRHDRASLTGLLSQVIERGRAVSCG